jgi:hypothetical protein
MQADWKDFPRIVRKRACSFNEFLKLGSPKLYVTKTAEPYLAIKKYGTGGPPLVRSPLVRIPLVRILVL